MAAALQLADTRGQSRRRSLGHGLTQARRDVADRYGRDVRDVAPEPAHLDALLGYIEEEDWDGDLWETDELAVRADDPDAPPPIELANGRVRMVGSRAPRDICGQEVPLACGDCGTYVLTNDPIDCASPVCHRCRGLYVAQRASAIAYRIRVWEDRQKASRQSYWLRHVIVSPTNADEPQTREQAKELLNRAWDVAERKGALGGVGFLHPWRGHRGDRGWEEGWHAHLIVAMRTHHGVAGGRACCRCRGVGVEGREGPCCDGGCEDTRCAARRVARAKSRLWSARGRVTGLRGAGQLVPVDLAREFLKAEHAYETAKRHQCDRAWFYASYPVKRSGTVTLQAGRAQGIEVTRGVLGLAMYDLDHAGAILRDKTEDQNGEPLAEPREVVAHHTVRWFGEWSYRHMDMCEHERETERALRDGGASPQTCPECGGEDLVPIVGADPRDARMVWDNIAHRYIVEHIQQRGEPPPTDRRAPPWYRRWWEGQPDAPRVMLRLWSHVEGADQP